jgi:excisionase family DNA binding protein
VGNTEVLTVKEVQARLRLGRTSVYTRIRRGELPSLRLGTAVRVPADALAAWIAAHTAGGGGEDLPPAAGWLQPPVTSPKKPAR